MNSLMELVGWSSHIVFAISAAPQAWKSYREGHSKGLAAGMLGAWFYGETGAIVYNLYGGVYGPQLMNYLVNFIFLSIIIRYYLFPRKESK